MPLNDFRAIRTDDKNQTDFNGVLEYYLLRLVGNHDQLKSALEQLHLIILEESLLEGDELPTTQFISDRCQQLINSLKEKNALSERGFEELNNVIHQTLIYANLTEPTSIPRAKFLAIIQQNFNNIFLKIENGFRFQDEISDQKEIEKTTKIVQRKQQEKEIEHSNQPQPEVPQLEIIPGSTPVVFAAVEAAALGLVPVFIMIMLGANLASYNLLFIIGSGTITTALEGLNIHLNRRSLLTNLFYTLPRNLISSIFRNPNNQNENMPLLREAPINNADASINSISYGTMREQLVNTESLSERNNVVRVTLLPTPVPASAILAEEITEPGNENYDLTNDPGFEEKPLFRNN